MAPSRGSTLANPRLGQITGPGRAWHEPIAGWSRTHRLGHRPPLRDPRHFVSHRTHPLGCTTQQLTTRSGLCNRPLDWVTDYLNCIFQIADPFPLDSFFFLTPPRPSESSAIAGKSLSSALELSARVLVTLDFPLGDSLCPKLAPWWMYLSP
jgi:hypothetical protein